MPTTPAENIVRRQKRTWQRVKSGLRKKSLPGQGVRFLTLTSSVDAPKGAAALSTSWRTLKERLRRRGLLSGYIKVMEVSAGGMRHLHVVIRGKYVHQRIWSVLWWDIHRSPIVDIRRWKGNKEGQASYLSKYLTKTSDGYVSWGWGWLWAGFGQDWKNIKRYYLNRGYGISLAILAWNKLIDDLPPLRAGPHPAFLVSGPPNACGACYICRGSIALAITQGQDSSWRKGVGSRCVDSKATFRVQEWGVDTPPDLALQLRWLPHVLSKGSPTVA